jgi:hypothetical protein
MKHPFFRIDFGHLRKPIKQYSFDLNLLIHEESTESCICQKFQPVQLSIWSFIESPLWEKINILTNFDCSYLHIGRL